MEALAANPRFKVLPRSGKGFIIRRAALSVASMLAS
jgi:hypothetical protein